MNNPSNRLAHRIFKNGTIIFLLSLLLSWTNAFAEDWLYEVQPGDNLWKLSKQHLINMRYWKKLQVLNDIQNPLHLPPGSKLRFPIAWLKSGSSVARIVALTGDAKILQHRTGRITEADKSMLLWENDTIQTAGGANATIQFVDGSKLLLQENSELRLDKLTGYGTTGMAKTRVRLKKGRTENRVTPKSGPASRFEIATPSAVAAVRGTEYRLSAEDNGESKTEVIRGEVGVSSVGDTKVIPKGFGTIAYKDRKPLDPVKLLDPPDLAGLPSTLIRVPFHLTIVQIEGAKQYRLQIAEDETFESLLFDSTLASIEMAGPYLADGKYFLRIRGIDSRGLEGFDSTHPFVIDAHPLPPLQIEPVADAYILEPTPTFKWSEPGDAFGYRFQIAQDALFEQLVVDEPGYDKTSLTLTSELAPGTYFWRVATTDINGKSGPFSDPQPFSKSPANPDITDSQLDTGEMVFSWRRGESGQKYRCQVSSDKDFNRIVADEIVTDSRYSFKDFDHGSYYIKIAVIDTSGNQSPFSPYQKAVVPPPFWVPWLVPVAVVLMMLL